MKNKRLKNLLIVGLIASISLNIYLFQQSNDNNIDTRKEAFKRVQNGVDYAYNFGDILQRNFSDMSFAEKQEHLTAMYWSLQLSTHMMEVVEPNDERYKELANLFDIYSNISSTQGLGRSLKKESTSDEKIIKSLDLWLTDIDYLNESLRTANLSEMDYSELKKYWGEMLQNLTYQNEQLNKYKESFVSSLSQPVTAIDQNSSNSDFQGLILQIKESSIIVGTDDVDPEASYPTYEIVIDDTTEISGDAEKFKGLKVNQNVKLWVEGKVPVNQINNKTATKLVVRD